MILIGAPIRLSAYDELGIKFTFRLSTPDRLVTTAVYCYLQHPNYSGAAVVCSANTGLFSRWDAVSACFLKSSSAFCGVSEPGYSLWAFLAVATLRILVANLRVQDEEAMFKGEGWEGSGRSGIQGRQNLFLTSSREDVRTTCCV